MVVAAAAVSVSTTVTVAAEEMAELARSSIKEVNFIASVVCFLFAVSTIWKLSRWPHLNTVMGAVVSGAGQETPKPFV